MREEKIWRLSWLKVVSFLTHHTQYTSSFTNCTVYTHHAHPVSRYSSICAVIPTGGNVSIVAKNIRNPCLHPILWSYSSSSFAVTSIGCPYRRGNRRQGRATQRSAPSPAGPGKTAGEGSCKKKVFVFLPTNYNCPTKLTLSRPSPWSPHCTNSAFALSDTWYRFMTDV